MLSFFPRGVLDEILNLIESVSEGFPSYSSLFKSRIFPNFEEILFNAWSLQNYGDLFVAGLYNELCALEFRKLHAKVKIKIKILLWKTSFIKMERNAYIS